MYSMPSGPNTKPCRLPLVSCPNPLRITWRLSARPSASSSVKTTTSGGSATYNLPSRHARPIGQTSLSANDLRRIELPVSIGVFQHANAAVSRAGFELGVQVETGRLGDEQTTVVGECAEHRKPNPQIVGHAIDDKSVRHM